MTEVAAGRLFLGEDVDPAAHSRTGSAVQLPAKDLTTHGVIVGMTGSGKTGLGITLIEEALLQGVPVIALDPKGDLGNLLLTFPQLRAEDFAPWVEGGDADAVSKQWSDGLASWGIDGTRIQALRDGADFTIYTPGSSAGVPLNVLGALRRPAEGADDETVLDEVSGFVSGLLGLVGIEADPLSSREHILLSNLVANAWATGTDIDLAGLIGQVQQPPMRKLGVLELDTFFPAPDRTQLALRLNGLLASPSFAAWSAGDPLDIDALLRPQGADGKAGCAIVALSHLSDEERQLVVTAVLSKLVTWMRRLPGTVDLRVLVYFDEVVGFVPPTSAPAAKKPILTLLKQARAFGVGIVLATQNPVDVDYKALSNAGTWMIGRLQTERDKSRLLDGMSAAAGGVDVAAVSDTISGLAKREFVLRRAGTDKPEVFTTRWAMSYLRGPLTREQIATLMAGRIAAASLRQSTQPGASAPAASADDAVAVAPAIAPGVPVGWLDPAAPWAQQVGAVPTSTRFAPGLAVRASLLYDDTASGLHETEEWEAVLFPLGAVLYPSSIVLVDHDPRDFLPAVPTGASYVITDAPLDKKAFFDDAREAVAAQLQRSRTATLWRNKALKLVSRPGETQEQFAARCAEAATAEGDKEEVALRAKFEDRIARAQDAIEVARDRVEQTKTAQQTRRSEELLTGATSLLDAFLGGKRSARRIARSVSGAASRRGRSSEAAQRVETAENRVQDKVDALTDLQNDLADALAAIDEKWDAKAADVEAVEVPLEKGDIDITALMLVWIPVA
jgi:hypothetical protein